jgi:hypothetical protein
MDAYLTMDTDWFDMTGDLLREMYTHKKVTAFHVHDFKKIF